MVQESNHVGVDRAALRAIDPPGSAPLLTVIVPVYNEEATVSELLARVLSAPYSKQVIVVDDGSTDGTSDALRHWQDEAQFEFLRHEFNRGTGAAIRTALRHARGRFTIIQDADLEYDPENYQRLIGPLLAGEARAVFGSRYLGETPHERLSKKVSAALRTVNSRLRSGMKSFARRATSALEAVRRRSTWDTKARSEQATDSEVHPTQAPGSQVRPAKRGSQRWGPRRLGAALLKLAARCLYGARLSDVSASLKAFSTDLLRKLDLECERFEFGPEVAAKLCRAGEKIVEVPVHYERRVALGSWIMNRFVRRPPATGDRGPLQRQAGKKHRWNDGLQALDTLWRWRHWAPQSPDPERIPAVAPATIAAGVQKPAAPEMVSAGLQTDIDRWAEDDTSRSAIDEALWNVPRTTEATAVGSLAEAESTATSDARQPEFSAAGAMQSAAGGFDHVFDWQRFRKPAPRPADESDDSDKGEDWEHWNLTDLLLLLAIVNIGLILLVTMVAPFSSWSGLLLAVLASAVTFRTTRAGKIQFDKCNQAFALLTVLLVCPMFPSSWVWRGRTMIILAAFALLAGLARLRSKGIRQPERNLLDLIGVLALFFAGLHVASPDRRAIEVLVLLVIVTLFLGVHQRRKMRRPSDNRLLAGAAICVFLVVVFSYLFPIDLWRLPWRETWLRFEYKVLPHWADYWWFRWGIVTALAALVAALLVNRAKRSEA